MWQCTQRRNHFACPLFSSTRCPISHPTGFTQVLKEMRGFFFTLLAVIWGAINLQCVVSHADQPLSKIAIHETKVAIHDEAYVKASPSLIGLGGKTTEWVKVQFSYPNPTVDDWIGVFSPANFSTSTCLPENQMVNPPLLCTAPIKYQYANFSNPTYVLTGEGSLMFQLINQRANFSFALFTDGLLNPKLVAVSNVITFANPKAPVYPRLAQGKSWDEMTVTWTSGYGISDAVPVVEWGLKGAASIISPAGTLTFDRSSMCGATASTVGWLGPSSHMVAAHIEMLAEFPSSDSFS